MKKSLGRHKYKIKFVTKLRTQVDGWSDWKDTEYRIDVYKEIVTVEAKNMKHAQQLALKRAKGYYLSRRFNSGMCKWGKDNIKKVIRLYKDSQ